MDSDARIKFHTQLKVICPNVYFQPPEGFQMTYPCILYARDGGDSSFANNRSYIQNNRVMITVIEKDPYTPLSLQVKESMDGVEFQDQFPQDNMYHSILYAYNKF